MRGGDFEMWFWLVSKTAIDLVDILATSNASETIAARNWVREVWVPDPDAVTGTDLEGTDVIVVNPRSTRAQHAKLLKDIQRLAGREVRMEVVDRETLEKWRKQRGLGKAIRKAKRVYPPSG